MKRVLFVTTNDWASWGGSELLWVELAEKFLEQGVQIGICIKSWDNLPVKIKELSRLGSVVFFLRPTKITIYNKILNGIILRINKDLNIHVYQKKILQWNPELAIVSQGGNNDGTDIMNFLLKNEIRYFSVSQAAFEGWWPDDNLAEKMNLAFSGAIINFFVSEANQSLTELQLGRKLDNSLVIRNPFNVPYNNKFNFSALDTFKLACVARLELYSKGQDILLEVLNQEKWRERNLIVNFYGSGVHEQSISKIVKFYGLTNVNIKGYSDTSAIWQDNHALILPSRYEGLPLSLVEAMLCGRFGIVTNVSGNKEVLIDNVNGFLAKAPNAECLDLAMERAWVRRNEWEQIGSNAKEYIKSWFLKILDLNFIKL